MNKKQKELLRAELTILEKEIIIVKNNQPSAMLIELLQELKRRIEVLS
tara:strand:+ start:627 stop:770 length:144 start_codon:yes stop_codon:yes gene_type:complete